MTMTMSQQGQRQRLVLHRALSLRSNLIAVVQQRCFQYTVPSSDDDDDDDKMLILETAMLLTDIV
jgi:hypothetical protein